MENHSDEASTRPTLDTILQRINALSDTVTGEINSLRDEFRVFRGEIDVRLDRIESMTNQTRAEMLTLRADFREFARS